MAVVGQSVQGGTSWAKVRLTRGQSAGGVWEIDQQYPQARLAIGSDPSAGWAVQAPGVRPMHFELYWDGRCLFVADTQRVGGVTLNGAALGPDWTQVRGRGEVVFGQAAMAVETSEGQAIALPDPASARRIAPNEGPSAQHNLGELTGEATRMTDSQWDAAPSLTGEATRIQDSPLDVSPGGAPKLGAVPPPPPGARPRLGGSDNQQVGQAKTLMQDELASAVNEATRMVAIPEGQPSIVVAPGMGGQQMGAQPVGMQNNAPFGAPAAGGTAPTGPGGFAAPPGFGEGPPPMTKQPSKFSPRMIVMVVLLLVAIAVLVAVGFSDLGGGGQVAIPTTVVPSTVVPSTAVPTTAVPTTVVPTTVVPTTSVYVPPTTVAGYPPTTVAIPPTTVAVLPPTTVAIPPTTVAVLPPPSTAVAPPPTTVVDPSVPLPPTQERLAADQVLAGRYADALPLYQALATQHPERPEYSSMVLILEQRIRAAQCVNGIGPDGRPCATR